LCRRRHNYDLRHTYASLRLAEQRLSLREIADQLGNSLATLASTYAHVIADLKGQPPVDPDKLIATARRRRAAGRGRGRAAS
jgi:integrase